MTSMASEMTGRPGMSPWPAVLCLSLLTFVLIASEFMPVSLLTPLARDLAITEGQAGQAIAVSGFFAVTASLFGNVLVVRIDRRTVVLLCTAILVLSGIAVAFAPNFAVFMVGRALVGISIGGIWSLSTSIMARLVSEAQLAMALSMLQGGTALAAVIAAPLGSFLGGLIGWRGAFSVVIPIGLAALAWQFVALPRMPAEGRDVSVRAMFGLLRLPLFAIGTAATGLAFMGQFALSTYLRPYLESVTRLDVNALSLVLLGIGVAGLAGTVAFGFQVRTHLRPALIGLPAVLALLALLLIASGPNAIATSLLLLAWGFFTTPIPIAWGTWMTRVIPADLEAGGALQVALIQFAITAGAFAGGALLDNAGWWSAFALGAALLAGSAILALYAGPRAATI